MNEGGLTDQQPLAHRRATPADADTHDLAVALVPALSAHCDGRLGHIDWFRAAWQRGGAATGFSTWNLDSGHQIPVIVKLPVSPREHRWTTALGNTPHHAWHDNDSLCLATPRVLASGIELGGYDLAWLITERLQGPTLSSNLSEAAVMDLLHAAADFQGAALRVANIDDRPPTPPWEKTLEHSREMVRDGGLIESQRWNEAIKKVQRSLSTLRSRWEARPINAWCHGDLHPGNALRRPVPDPDPTGRRGCVLIDLALVHPGHWVEDALYLERQFWGHSDMLHGIKPVSLLAKYRRNNGLPADDHYAELATVRRVLMAACAPALIEREGNPKYLHACLELIEKFLPQAVK